MILNKNKNYLSAVWYLIFGIAIHSIYELLIGADFFYEGVIDGAFQDNKSPSKLVNNFPFWIKYAISIISIGVFAITTSLINRLLRIDIRTISFTSNLRIFAYLYAQNLIIEIIAYIIFFWSNDMIWAGFGFTYLFLFFKNVWKTGFLNTGCRLLLVLVVSGTILALLYLALGTLLL